MTGGDVVVIPEPVQYLGQLLVDLGDTLGRHDLVLRLPLLGRGLDPLDSPVVLARHRVA